MLSHFHTLPVIAFDTDAAGIKTTTVQFNPKQRLNYVARSPDGFTIDTISDGGDNLKPGNYWRTMVRRNVDLFIQEDNDKLCSYPLDLFEQNYEVATMQKETHTDPSNVSAEQISTYADKSLSEWMGKENRRSLEGTQIYPIVLRAFDHGIDSSYRMQLKSLIEKSPLQIEGFTSGFSFEGIGSRFTLNGSSGLAFTLPADMFDTVEKYINWWVGKMGHELAAAPFNSVDIAFVEPAPDFTTIKRAWIGKNMQPSYFNGRDYMYDRNAKVENDSPPAFTLSGSIKYYSDPSDIPDEMLNIFNVLADDVLAHLKKIGESW